MLDFKCPGCTAAHQLPDRVIGRKFRCPTCKAKVKHHADGRFEIRETSPNSAPSPDLPQDDDIPEISLPTAPVIPAEPPTSPRFSPESLSGTIVGNYRLIGHLGSGAGGHVYLAEHLTLKRKMAVKLLAPVLTPSADRVARMAQEAVALAKVDHPNVVHVYDFWVDRGTPYIAMQFVDGPSLDQAIKSSGPFPMEKLQKLAHDLLLGLDVIHQAGLLHRDIKPSNVLLSKEGDARLADFGLAWETPQVSALPANIFSGTAEYAAPELAVGKPPDERSDLYALGATLYKAATGRTPFSGGSVAEKLKKQLYEPLPDPRSLNPRISAPFEHFLVKLLSKDRESRPAGAREAIRLLGPTSEGAPARKTRRIVAVKTSPMPLGPMLFAGCIVVAALGIIAYLATHPKQAASARGMEKAAGSTRTPEPEIPVPASAKGRVKTVHPSEQRDFDRLEVIRATEPLAAAIDAHTEFLQRYPKSEYCETVLINKMELQRELERENTRRVPDPVRAPTPPPSPPIPPPPAPARVVQRLKKSGDGVPCRTLPPSIRDGLVWLARHQADGGTWDMKQYPQLCTGAGSCALNQEMGSTSFHTGIHSLALLAFLGAGIGLNDRDETGGVNLGDSVREGVRYLVRSQSSDGRIGNTNVPKYIYGQALAVNALAEAVRSLSSGSVLSADEARTIREALQRAAQFLVAAQNQGAGWRYSQKSGDNDSSVTAAALLALHAARNAGARVPDFAFEYGLLWFEDATDPRDQRVGYNARGTGKVYVPGKNEQYRDHPTMTAAAGVCQALLGKGAREPSKAAIQLVLKDPPRPDLNSVDYYYWYYGTRFALARFEPKDQEIWKSAVVKWLTASQSAEAGSCKEGGWLPNDRWGVEGGRLYATAINTLTLCYALLPGPFSFNSGAKADVVALPTTSWIILLKNGGKVLAVSYAEKEDVYEVRVPTGTIRIAKSEVEEIIRGELKGR